MCVWERQLDTSLPDYTKVSHIDIECDTLTMIIIGLHLDVYTVEPFSVYTMVDKWC